LTDGVSLASKARICHRLGLQNASNTHTCRQ
jgi:hypothetical protein